MFIPGLFLGTAVVACVLGLLGHEDNVIVGASLVFYGAVLAIYGG